MAPRKKDQEELSLDQKLREINKKYNNAVSKGITKTYEKVSSGSLTFDYVLDGGYDKSSIFLFWGGYSSLKTTMALKMLANAQKERDAIGLIVDVEGGFDKKRAINLGVDTSPDKLLILDEPMSCEGYFDIICDLCNYVDFIIIDSMSAMIPKYVDEKNLEDGQVRASLASSLSNSLGKLNKVRKDTTIILIGHAKVNPNSFGGAVVEYVNGGASPKFFSNYEFQFKVTAKYDKEWNDITKQINKEETNDYSGVELKLLNKKNRRGTPFRVTTFLVDLETGNINENNELRRLADKFGIIESNGGFRNIKGYEKSIRPSEVETLLDTDKDFRDNIVKQIKDIIYTDEA